MPDTFRIGKLERNFVYMKIAEGFFACIRGTEVTRPGTVPTTILYLIYDANEMWKWVAYEADVGLGTPEEVKERGTPVFASTSDILTPGVWHEWTAGYLM